MKIKYIKYALLSSVLTLGSCSKDYLDTTPTTATSPDTAFKTTENAKMAVNGIAKLMVSQYMSSQGYNGEGTIKLWYGEFAGNNFRKDLIGYSTIMNGTLLSNSTHTFNYYPWYYYYMLIANANAVIEKIDGADGPENTKKYLKAQALAYRAYSYSMLAQIYGNRWQDSNNGEQKSLILRTSTTQPKDIPLSSLGSVYVQIYSDLDTALQLFDQSGYIRGKDNYLIDANVVHAIYARAAINKQDFTVALREAELAKKGYPLMSVAAYKDGFANPTSEWIWSSYGASDENLQFYSYQANMAYNSSAGAVRNYPNRISKELYETIPVSDIRSTLFLNPKGYDAKTYDPSTGVVKAKSPIDIDTRTKYPGIQTTALVAAFMQLKIAANDQPGVGHLNHFRSSEMYLIEAEALHFLGRDAESAKVLESLTKGSGRDVNYTCNKTGVALFNEIVK